LCGRRARRLGVLGHNAVSFPTPFLSFPLITGLRVGESNETSTWMVSSLPLLPAGNAIGIPNAFTNSVGKQMSGSPSLGAAGTSSFVSPSSPMTNPETPWGRPGPPQVGDGESVTSGAVRGIKGAWIMEGWQGWQGVGTYGSVEGAYWRSGVLGWLLCWCCGLWFG
jgi:hypothetical protein